MTGKEREKIIPTKGVICPFCRQGDRLVWTGNDIVCESCDKVAFKWDNGELRRVDYVEPDWLTPVKPEPYSHVVKSVPFKEKKTQRRLFDG